MKTVFEPSNALEGHMLQDLLKQQGISARLDGAGLQSGVGELPAIGLVRLVVDDEDYVAARRVIDDWETSAVADPIPTAPRQPLGALVGALVGLVIGMGGAFIYFRAPLDGEGIDHNVDGALDERWKLSPSGTLVATEIDRNYDGAVDLVWRFDHRGVVTSGESDEDFNGTFESQLKLRRGQVYLTETDTNGDSIADVTSRFAYGVLTSVEHSAEDPAKPVRVETFRLGKLVSAEVDSNRDGTLDRRYRYDEFGEIVSVDEINAST
jgi:hypothetical protein